MTFSKVLLVSSAILACAGSFAFSSSDAASLDAPKSKPILTISGDITQTNSAQGAQFDRGMLEALGMVTVETTTPWYKGPMKFEGVPLEKLMADVGAKGTRVVTFALDGYSTEIPVEDFAKFHTILALKRNGEYMPTRDKGPLFVIYPYDSNPELKSDTYYHRSAWQVERMVVK